MDAAETQFEQISLERQRECWQEFAHFLNRQFKIESAAPAPIVAAEQSVKAADDALTTNPDEDDTDAPDEADATTFARLDKPTAFRRAAIA